MAAGAVAGSIIAPILGGIIGNEMGRGDRNRAEDQMRSIQDLYNKILLPDIEQQKLNLEEYGAGQMITPEQQQVREMSMRDQLQDVNLDPRLRQTQMNALDTLSKIAGSGFTPDEMNALQQQREARESDLTSKMKQLQQQQDMRGIGNSDLALSQRMMEAQGSTNRNAQEARDMQAQGFRRSLDAISQGAGLASGIEGNDYNRQAQLASALRGRESTNLQNRIGIEGNNIDRFNRALEMNVNRNNTTGDRNVGLRNDQQEFNKDLPNKRFAQELELARGKAGAAGGMADVYNSRADRIGRQFTGGGAAVGEGFAAFGKSSKTPKIETV